MAQAPWVEVTSGGKPVHSIVKEQEFAVKVWVPYDKTETIAPNITVQIETAYGTRSVSLAPGRFDAKPRHAEVPQQPADPGARWGRRRFDRAVEARVVVG